MNLIFSRANEHSSKLQRASLKYCTLYSPFDEVVAIVVVAGVAVAVAVGVAEHCTVPMIGTCGGGNGTLSAVTKIT